MSAIRVYVQVMICKVNFSKILLPQESKVSTFYLKLKSGPEDEDQGHGLLLQHQGPKRVCPVTFPTKVSKYIFPKVQIRLCGWGTGPRPATPTSRSKKSLSCTISYKGKQSKYIFPKDQTRDCEGVCRLSRNL